MSTNEPSVSYHSIVPLLQAEEGRRSPAYNLEGVSSLTVNSGILETIDETKKPNCLPFEPRLRSNLFLKILGQPFMAV